MDQRQALEAEATLLGPCADLVSGPQAASGRPKAAALYQVGIARLQLGDVRGAYEDFKEASRIEPFNREIWLKYDETYKQVEAEIDQEHAMELQAARMRNDTSMQPTASSSSSFRPDRFVGPPPHFVKELPKFDQLQPLQTVNESADREAQERALALQVGMLRGVLGGGATDSVAEQYGGAKPSNRRERTLTDKSEDMDEGSGRSRRDGLEVQMSSNKGIWMAICMCWISMVFNTIFFYWRQYTGSNPSGILLVCMMMACGGLAYACWRCIRRNKPLHLQMTDVIKIVCLFFILLLVLFYYLKNIGREGRPSTAPSTSTTLAPELLNELS